MKKYIIAIFIILAIKIAGQSQGLKRIEGNVSYVNTANVYVQFANTSDLVENDTLLILINKTWIKGLVVKVVSSKSCLTNSIIPEIIEVGSKVAYEVKLSAKVEPVIVNTLSEIMARDSLIISQKRSSKLTGVSNDRVQTFDGRVSISTNGSMDQSSKDFNRIRTSSTFNINNINGSRLSLQSYLVHQRRFGIEDYKFDFNNEFKFYTLSLDYQVSDQTIISLGRKMNNRMANMGAIDGLQIEHKFKSILVGAFAGTRPDNENYGYNISMFEAGGFIGHEVEIGKGIMQTTVAFAEQRNHTNTNRRFVYLQHSNSIVKNISLFYSVEFDLFQNIDNVKSNNINLTSTYASLRFRPTRKLSFNIAYDNRKNIIYYETYRNYLDQLLTQETRRGFRLNMNHNLSKVLSFNISAFYRYQASQPEPTKNYVGSINLSQILGKNSYLNLNVNSMNTYYFGGKIFGARLNKDLFKSRLNTEISYRKVDYTFVNAEQSDMNQNILGFSANIYGKKRTSFMFSYEGTFDPQQNYNRYYITLSQRFKDKK